MKGLKEGIGLFTSRPMPPSNSPCLLPLLVPPWGAEGYSRECVLRTCISSVNRFSKDTYFLRQDDDTYCFSRSGVKGQGHTYTSTKPAQINSTMANTLFCLWNYINLLVHLSFNLWLCQRNSQIHVIMKKWWNLSILEKF